MRARRADPDLEEVEDAGDQAISPDAAPDGPAARAWQGVSGPFVLLDDARPGGRALALHRAGARSSRRAIPTRSAPASSGCAAAHAAGFLAYEAGHALEPKLAPLRRAPAPDEPPLLWFGLFDAPEEVDAAALAARPRRRLGRARRGR